MKKRLTMLAALCMALSLPISSLVLRTYADPEEGSEESLEETSESFEDTMSEAEIDGPAAKCEGSMTYDEFLAAEYDAQVVVEGFVQEISEWDEEHASIDILLADGEGLYPVENLSCEDYELKDLTQGRKIIVHGYRAGDAQAYVCDAYFEVCPEGAEPYILDEYRESEEETSDEESVEDNRSQYEAFKEATLGETVELDLYIQSVQSYIDGYITLYGADEDGFYYLKDIYCPSEFVENITGGIEFHVSGVKNSVNGEIMITDGSMDFPEEPGSLFRNSVDLTELLYNGEEIDAYMNNLFRAYCVTVKAADQESVFLYGSDGNGEAGDDIYLKIKVGKNVYTCCISAGYTGAYEAVSDLKAGSQIDIAGFLQWNDGPVFQIVEITEARANAKGIGVMNWKKFKKCESGDEVVVEGFVQHIGAWKDGCVTLYMADGKGVYRVSELECTKLQAERLERGRKIRVTGYKYVSDGNTEIRFGQLRFLDRDYFYSIHPEDITKAYTDMGFDLSVNSYVCLKNCVVQESEYGPAVYYGYDGSGTEGDDLYLCISIGSYLYYVYADTAFLGEVTELDEKLLELRIGQTIDLEGYIYNNDGSPVMIITDYSETEKVKEE